MNPVTIIPARMAALRLPGKPLADIWGEPMILHVWRRAARADIGPVVVAAAETEVVDIIRAAGGQAVLTDPELPSGSDRVFAALETFDPSGKHDVVINLQGDLPDIDPASLHAVRDALKNSDSDIATPVAEISDAADFDNPNVVKPVVAWDSDHRFGRALYFTRSRAPYGSGPLYHHIGVYAFRRAALARFVALPPSELEKREKLEQLRALEAGMSIAVARVENIPVSVDTAEDLEKARAVLKQELS